MISVQSTCIQFVDNFLVRQFTGKYPNPSTYVKFFSPNLFWVIQYADYEFDIHFCSKTVFIASRTVEIISDEITSITRVYLI
jgi:hypothetical protein